MVGVAQLVERWIVVPVAEGSNPSTHPKQRERAVRQQRWRPRSECRAGRSTFSAVVRQQLENFWREKLQQSRTRFEAGKEHAKQAITERNEALTPSSDGAFAVSQSSQAESRALAEYRRVLLLFTDLVVHGKMPPEDC